MYNGNLIQLLKLGSIDYPAFPHRSISYHGYTNPRYPYKYTRLGYHISLQLFGLSVDFEGCSTWFFISGFSNIIHVKRYLYILIRGGSLKPLIMFPF